jgi:hypothetical protein
VSAADRRLVLAALGSLAAHAAFIGLLLVVDAPPDTGFEFTVPVEVQLGLTDQTEMEAAPVETAPPSEETSASQGGDPTQPGEGTMDAGVIADAGVGDGGDDGGRPDAGRRRRRDAGVDAGPLVAGGGTDGGSPVAFLPAGAQIALRVDMDRIRSSDLRPEVEGLLAAIPDWEAVLGGSGVEPVRDLSRVLVATPNFLRSNIVVAGSLSDAAPPPREIAERLASAHGHTVEWTEEDGIESAPFYSPDGADRRVAILDARHFVLSKPEDLPRVLAIAAARAHDGSDPAEALLSMGEGEAVSVEVEGLAAFVRRSPCEVARRARVAMIDGVGTIPGEQRVGLEGVAWFDSEEQAASARECLDGIRARAAANILVAAMGLAVPLQTLTLEAEGTELHAHGSLTYGQLRRILGMLRGMLQRPPPPPVPPVPPPSAPPVTMVPLPPRTDLPVPTDLPPG